MTANDNQLHGPGSQNDWRLFARFAAEAAWDIMDETLSQASPDYDEGWAVGRLEMARQCLAAAREFGAMESSLDQSEADPSP